MADLDDLKNAAGEHSDQVNQGLDKAGDAVSDRLGHDDQVDSAVGKAEDALGTSDQQQPSS